MQKKTFLTESVRKQILADKEKAILESFAKNFNKIKRSEEDEVNEGWGTNLAAGLAATVGGLGGAQAQDKAQTPPPQQISQTTNDVNSVVAKGGLDLGARLVAAYKANPKAAEQWGTRHRNTSLLPLIKNAIHYKHGDKDLAGLGDMFNGSQSTPAKVVASYLTATEGNAAQY
jgi:hypothetical protein